MKFQKYLNRFNWLFPFMYIPKGYDKNLCLSHLKDIFNRYEIKILNKKVLCQFSFLETREIMVYHMINGV